MTTTPAPAPTYSHIAKPADSRCRWWQKVLSPEQLATIDAAIVDGANDVPGDYLRKGADLELPPGSVLIDGEANHPVKQRGWAYTVGIVNADATEIDWRKVCITEDKKEMKAAGFPVTGSGPVAAAVRLAQFLTR